VVKYKLGGRKRGREHCCQK